MLGETMFESPKCQQTVALLRPLQVPAWVERLLVLEEFTGLQLLLINHLLLLRELAPVLLALNTNTNKI